jgi:hypothetical protein
LKNLGILGKLHTEKAQGDFRWALFTPPKSYESNPNQIKALESWLHLRIPPQIFVFQAGDLHMNELEMLAQRYGVTSIKCKSNAAGLLLVST